MIQTSLKTVLHRHTQALFLVGSFCLYLYSRLWAWMQYGERAFGYDTGIYKHIIAGYFDRLADPTIVPFGFSWVSNTWLVLGMSTDDLMWVGHIVIACILWWALYYVIKVYASKHVAVVSICLFSISLVQYEFFWWYYYRNSLSLILVLVSLLFLYRKSYFLVPTLILVGIVHPVSLVPVGLLMIWAVVFDKERRTFLLVAGACSLACVLLVSWRELMGYRALIAGVEGISVSPAGGGSDELSGQFLQSSQFVVYLLLYAPLAVYGFFRTWKTHHLYISVYALILGVLTFLQVVFYRRLFVWIDIMFILYASYGVVHLYTQIRQTAWKKYVALVLGVVYIVVTSLLLRHIVMTKQPLVTEEELWAIQQLERLADETDAGIMVVSPYYAPWVYGFADEHVIAPGMFESNLWSAERWHTFWNTQDSEERNAMLAEYQKPIYIFLGEHDKRFGYAFSGDPHMTHVDLFLWRFDL